MKLLWPQSFRNMSEMIPVKHFGVTSKGIMAPTPVAVLSYLSHKTPHSGGGCRQSNGKKNLTALRVISWSEKAGMHGCDKTALVFKKQLSPKQRLPRGWSGCVGIRPENKHQQNSHHEVKTTLLAITAATWKCGRLELPLVFVWCDDR